jgi:predicted nucleic acid-binding protein
VSSYAEHPPCLLDASIALKWFLPVDREPDSALARSLIGRVALRTTDLCVYEVGNILTRRSGWPAPQIGSALALLREICGDPLELLPGDHDACVQIALDHGLTFYDASYATIAARTGRVLVSAARDLLEPGLAVGLAAIPATSG